MGDAVSILYHFIQEVFIELDIEIITESMPEITTEIYSVVPPVYEGQQVYKTIGGDVEASKGLLMNLMDWYHHLHAYKPKPIDQYDPRVRVKIEEILLARQTCQHKMEDKAKNLFGKGEDGKSVFLVLPDPWKAFVDTVRVEIAEYMSKFDRLEIEISDISEAAGGTVNWYLKCDVKEDED
ncbi:hypothetical protein F4678DRAFT_477246 [Xylaria arbuscula]|nr:hypothetical protein F4678DRAFT_477246 [Xylaria arbuscula]